jgi:hypothetical protein
MRAYAYVFAGLAALSLAACGGGGGWQKQGASAEQRSQDLAECQADARSVLQRDTAIDADILASRSYDWQKSNTLSTRQESMRSTNRGRSEEIIGRCMMGKGYLPASSGD